MRRLQLQERYDKIASIVSGCLLQHRRKPDGSSSIPYASIGLFHLFGIMPEEVIENSVAAQGAHPSQRCDPDHMRHFTSRRGR